MRIQRLEESKQDIQNFIDKFGQDTYDLFIKSKDRLKNNKLSTDITWHTKNTSPEEMNNILSTLQQKVGGNKDLSKTDFSKEQIPGKYNYLGRMGGYDVYEPLDYISSMALGVNTGWCTTGRYGHYGDQNFTPSESHAKEHFDAYTDGGYRLIYLLDPKTHYGEIAIAVYPRTLPVPDDQKFVRSGDKIISFNKTNFEIFNAQDDNDYSLLDSVPESLKEKLGLVIDAEELSDFSKATQINPNEVEDITLLSVEEAKQLPESILDCGNMWWLRSPGGSPYYAVCVGGNGSIRKYGLYVDYDGATVRPSLKISNLDSSNFEIGDVVKCFNIPWYYIGNDMILSVIPITSMEYNKDGKKGNEYEGSDIQKYLQNWLQEQMSKNESLKRGNKMTFEDYKKNRKARLQRLSEALDNLPELTDGKAHIEVDAVTGGAKEEAEDRKKQVKDSFKDKNKETREFIKKQDKDREVDKEEKSENRLMLDESLFNEEVVEKKFNESLYSDAIDVVYDLVDRAKGWIDDGSDKDEAIQQAIDDGLIYSDDIFALARYFGGIDDSTLIDSFYESLYELMYEKLGDYGRENEEEDEE